MFTQSRQHLGMAYGHIIPFTLGTETSLLEGEVPRIALVVSLAMTLDHA